MKRVMLMMAIMLVMILAVPQIACFSETSQESQSQVDSILDRYIKAIGGREAIEKLTTRTIKGHVITDLKDRQIPVYEDHYFEAYAKAPNLYHAIEYSDGGPAHSGYDGSIGWAKDRCGVKQDDYSAHSKIAWVLNPQNALRVQEYFPDLAFDGQAKLDGKEVYKLKPAGRDETYYALYFAVDSGMLVAIGYHWYLQDWRQVDGVLMPTKVVAGRKGGSTTYIFDSIVHNQSLDDSLFMMVDGQR
jgi:hypothetical protein